MSEVAGFDFVDFDGTKVAGFVYRTKHVRFFSSGYREFQVVKVSLAGELMDSRNHISVKHFLERFPQFLFRKQLVDVEFVWVHGWVGRSILI